MRKHILSMGVATTATLIASLAAPCAAQSQDGDIIVTARKRDETSIAVPIAITAVGGAELQRRAIVSLDDLSQVVPQLLIGNGGGNVSSGNVVIRGLSGADSNSFADQAVSFNIDGVQVARAIVRRLAEMDTAQVEVLKGPQALFFGKNSPAGIISIRSADPTPTFQAKATLGYEVNAREIRGEGFISGPLTETIGARIAVYGTTMRGWEKNNFIDTTIYSPKDKHLPKTREIAVRGTLKWDPSDTFDARMKFTHSILRDAGVLTSYERKFCPDGVPQLGGGAEDCKFNGRMARRDFGPVLGTLRPEFAGGSPFLRQHQSIGALELNYEPRDGITLTSVTGYYDVYLRQADSYSAFDVNISLSNTGRYGIREISQEFRGRTSFDGPVNLLAGAFYQSSRALSASRSFVGLVTPRQIANLRIRQKGEAYSFFGQILVNPIEVIELTAGGRYSYEKKRLVTLESSPMLIIEPLPIPVDPRFPRKESWNNFSPEFTASYRPSSRLTIYGSYKRGFLSGGFNAGVGSLMGDLRYDQQTIEGFEGGVKAALLDGALRTNFALYSYKVGGLQVTTSTTTLTGGTVQNITNAGKVHVEGAEFDFNYRTPLSGLTLRGALGYNNGVYDIFTIGCYRGQTQAMGCNAGAPNPITGNYSTQDRAGTPLVRAPKWSGSLGVGYESNIGSALRVGMNADTSYTSSFFTDVTGNPNGKQSQYAILDANIRVGDQDDTWEVALIGRNLTNKYYSHRVVDLPLAGSDPGGLTGRLADTQGAVNRGRQFMIRLTAKIGS